MSGQKYLQDAGYTRYRYDNKPTLKQSKPNQWLMKGFKDDDPKKKVVVNRNTSYVDNLTLLRKERRPEVVKMQDHQVLPDGTIDWDPRTKTIESPGALKGVVSLDQPGNREMNLEKDARGLRYSPKGTLAENVKDSYTQTGRRLSEGSLGETTESVAVEKLAKGDPTWRPDGERDKRLEKEGRPHLWQVDV
jgi:hypothetical protein